MKIIYDTDRIEIEFKPTEGEVFELHQHPSRILEEGLEGNWLFKEITDQKTIKLVRYTK